MIKQYVTSKDIQDYVGCTLFSISFGVFCTTLQFNDRSIRINGNPRYVHDLMDVECDKYNTDSLSGIFSLLNEDVEKAELNADYSAILFFSEGRSIVLVSDKSGYECYVLENASGALPIY